MPFMSRGPRDRGEIKTCLRMLRDSPLCDPNQYTGGKLDEFVNVWENLLRNAEGIIIIIQNTDYDINISGVYDHDFHSVQFAYRITPDYARKIVSMRGVGDVNLFILQSLLDGRQCVSNEVDNGIYMFGTLVWHPAIVSVESMRNRILRDGGEYIARIGQDVTLTGVGFRYNALISQVYSEFLKDGYSSFGQKMLYEHDDNNSKEQSQKRYLFGVARDKEVSDFLGLGDTSVINAVDLANRYQRFFQVGERMAGLNRQDQNFCYLLMIGYNDEQIAGAMNTTKGNIHRIRHHVQNLLGLAYPELYVNGNGNNVHQLISVINANLHEIRQFMFSSYPWQGGYFRS